MRVGGALVDGRGEERTIINAAAAQNAMRAVTATAPVVRGAPVVAVTDTAAVSTEDRRGAGKKEQERGGRLSPAVVWGAVNKAVAICDARTEEMRRQPGDLS